MNIDIENLVQRLKNLNVALEGEESSFIVSELIPCVKHNATDENMHNVINLIDQKFTSGQSTKECACAALILFEWPGSRKWFDTHVMRNEKNARKESENGISE